LASTAFRSNSSHLVCGLLVVAGRSSSTRLFFVTAGCFLSLLLFWTRTLFSFLNKREAINRNRNCLKKEESERERRVCSNYFLPEPRCFRLLFISIRACPSSVVCIPSLSLHATYKKIAENKRKKTDRICERGREENEIEKIDYFGHI